MDVETSAAKLLQLQQALIGSWHLCHRSAIVQQVVSEPELSAFDLDFETCLRELVAIILGEGKTLHQGSR